MSGTKLACGLALVALMAQAATLSGTITVPPQPGHPGLADDPRPVNAPHARPQGVRQTVRVEGGRDVLDHGGSGGEVPDLRGRSA